MDGNTSGPERRSAAGELEDLERLPKALRLVVTRSDTGRSAASLLDLCARLGLELVTMRLRGELVDASHCRRSLDALIRELEVNSCDGLPREPVHNSQTIRWRTQHQRMLQSVERH